jgi:hypothetical protein
MCIHELITLYTTLPHFSFLNYTSMNLKGCFKNRYHSMNKSSGTYVFKDMSEQWSALWAKQYYGEERGSAGSEASWEGIWPPMPRVRIFSGGPIVFQNSGTFVLSTISKETQIEYSWSTQTCADWSTLPLPTTSPSRDCWGPSVSSEHWTPVMWLWVILEPCETQECEFGWKGEVRVSYWTCSSTK